MARGVAICSAVLALLLAVSVPLLRWLLPRVLWMSGQARGQVLYEPKRPPSLLLNEVRGLPVPPFVSTERISWIEDSFPHRPGDVWVTTYAKVGTTWTQYIVAQIFGYPKVTNTVGIFEVSPWPEAAAGIIATPLDGFHASAKGNRSRVFKSHWPRTDHMTKLPPESKVVFVYRGLEQVAVSFFHHMLNIFGLYWVEPEDLPWDVFFEKFISGDVDFGDYFEHLASWWKVRDDPNVHFVRFEDLKRDPHATIRGIAAFVGVQLDADRLDEIVEETSLKSMKRWSEGWIDRFFLFTGVFRGNHIRTGGAREKLLTPAQRARLEEKFEAILQPLGVPFEHMFPN